MVPVVHLCSQLHCSGIDGTHGSVGDHWSTAATGTGIHKVSSVWSVPAEMSAERACCMTQVTVGSIVATGADIHRTTAEQQAARAALQVGHHLQERCLFVVLPTLPMESMLEQPPHVGGSNTPKATRVINRSCMTHAQSAWRGLTNCPCAGAGDALG